MRRIALALVIGLTAGLLAVLPTSVRAAGGLTSDAIHAAKTAADHTAIADMYAKDAAELRQKAADHKAMLASYEKGPGYIKEKSGFIQHCQSLISYYEKAAQDADEMAKMHRDIAAKAK